MTTPNTPGSLAGHEHPPGFSCGCAYAARLEAQVATLEATVRSYQGSVPGIKYRTLEARLEAAERERGMAHTAARLMADRLAEIEKAMRQFADALTRPATAADEPREHRHERPTAMCWCGWSAITAEDGWLNPSSPAYSQAEQEAGE